MGWVPEGQRSASMSYSATPMVAPYVTLGEEDTVTFEAEAAAQGFEDINSTATLRLLQKTMRKEETALLGGNTSVALGTPPRRSLERRRLGRDAALRDLFGHRRRSHLRRLSQLLAEWRRRHTSKTITGNDGNTYTLNGGSSNRSANTTQAVTLGQTLFGDSVSIVNGAVAYAWFVGPPARRPCRRSPRSTARPSRRR